MKNVFESLNLGADRFVEWSRTTKAKKGEELMKTGWARIFTLSLSLFFLGFEAEAQSSRTPVTFRLDYPTAREVHLLGSFDTWVRSNATKMRQRNGVWVKTVSLPRGVHQYKFLVVADTDLEDGGWMVDPANPRWVPNVAGTRNSVILVPEDIKPDTARALIEVRRSLRRLHDQLTILMAGGRYADASATFDKMQEVIPGEWRNYHREIRSQIQAARMNKGTPPLEGPGLDGEIIRLSDFRGKVVLVDFWATWCGPCVAEFPNVKAAYDEFKDSGFVIIGVSLDSDTDKLRNYIREKQAAWPQIHDGRAWQSPNVAAWGVEGIPSTFLIDRDGRIVGTDLRGEELRAALIRVFRD
jgi:peroxiredoxin